MLVSYWSKGGDKLGDDMLILNSFPDWWIFKCSALIGSKKSITTSDFLFYILVLNFVFDVRSSPYLMIFSVIVLLVFWFFHKSLTFPLFSFIMEDEVMMPVVNEIAVSHFRTLYFRKFIFSKPALKRLLLFHVCYFAKYFNKFLIRNCMNLKKSLVKDSRSCARS